MFRDNDPIYEFRGPFGVPVQIGSSLVFLVLLYVSMGDIVWSLTFLSMLIVSIFLHEMGHAWATLVQGLPVRRVMIYGGGGFCERARSATARQQELIVAMGPIVNLVLWAVAGLVSEGLWNSIIAEAANSDNPDALFQGFKAELAGLLSMFSYLNGFLAVFNLIPVQPLDGGKLFHLILLRLIPQGVALRVTGVVGLVLSIIWIPAMVLVYATGGWFLLFFPSITLHWAMTKGQLA